MEPSTSVTFVKEYETKGAVRYNELDVDGQTTLKPNDPYAKIGTLYIRKRMFNGSDAPNKIVVTIKAG